MFIKTSQLILFITLFVILSFNANAESNKRTVYNYTDIPFRVSWTPDSSQYHTGCVTFNGQPNPCQPSSQIVSAALKLPEPFEPGIPGVMAINYIAASTNPTFEDYVIHGWMQFPEVDGVPGWGVVNRAADSAPWAFDIGLRAGVFKKDVKNKNGVTEKIVFVSNKSGANTASGTNYGDITICFENLPPCAGDPQVYYNVDYTKRTIYNYTELPFTIAWTRDKDAYVSGCVLFVSSYHISCSSAHNDLPAPQGEILPATTKSANGVTGSPSITPMLYSNDEKYGWVQFPHIYGHPGWGVGERAPFLKGGWFDLGISLFDIGINNETIRFVNNSSGTNDLSYDGDVTICYSDQPPCSDINKYANRVRAIYNYTNESLYIQWTPDTSTSNTGCIAFAGNTAPCASGQTTTFVIPPALQVSENNIAGFPSTTQMTYVGARLSMFGWVQFPKITGVPGWGVKINPVPLLFSPYLTGSSLDAVIGGKKITILNNRNGANPAVFPEDHNGDITICDPGQPPCNLP